ncbi:MAG TPA: type III secretion system chaperone [Burkholderiaceae bacterium]|jgi:hypothetical protein|nr:type III secretion system chaperone [Burkholderiaceae bacterium]
MDHELDILIRQLGPAGQFSFVKALRQPSTWQVGIGPVTVELAADWPRGVLVLTAGLGSPAATRDMDGLHAVFLDYAALWESTDGARIGRGASECGLVLLQDVGLPGADPAELVEVLREFAKKCEAWRLIVAGAGQHGEGEDAANALSDVAGYA